MSCSGSKEIGVRGTGSSTYSGLRLGVSSFSASQAARAAAWSDLQQKLTAEKATICQGLCAEGCVCAISDFPNPTAYNNPQISWSATRRGWLGISLGGAYTATYAYIVKAECRDPETE